MLRLNRVVVLKDFAVAHICLAYLFAVNATQLGEDPRYGLFLVHHPQTY